MDKRVFALAEMGLVSQVDINKAFLDACVPHQFAQKNERKGEGIKSLLMAQNFIDPSLKIPLSTALYDNHPVVARERTRFDEEGQVVAAATGGKK